MSQYYTSGNEILAEKKTKAKETAGKDLAENFLQEKGYERQVKPREINGGRDRVPQNHTVKNKARLNTALAKTPSTAKGVENIRKKEKKISVSRMEVRREIAKTPFPIPYIFCIVLLTVIFLYVIHLYIEIDDLNAELTDYNNMIVDMKEEEKKLDVQKNSMYNLEEIERIAREEYGMVNRDQLPKEYITPDSEDQIEIIDTKSGEAAPGALMSGFAKAISNLLSYIN